MRKLITCLLLLFWGIRLEGQDKGIDSLNRLINSAHSDTQRINLKIEKLRHLNHGNNDTAIAFARNLINEAKEVKYILGEAKARMMLSGDYCFAGDYALAKRNLDSAKRMLMPFSDSVAIAKLYYNYGMMYSMQNQFDSSHVFYNIALGIARRNENVDLLMTVLQDDAIAYQQESNLTKALTSYQEALTVAEKHNSKEDEAYISLNMAIAYNSLDDFKRAEQFFLKSIRLAEQLNLMNVLTYAYSNLGSMYGDRGDFKMSYDTSMKASVLGKQIGDKGIESSSLTRASFALASLNHFEDAIKLGELGVRISDSSRQPLSIYQAYNNVGLILTMEKNYQGAISYFEKSLHVLGASDIYVREVGKTYRTLAECYEKTGDFKKALAAYQTGVKIADSVLGKENVRKTTELTMNYEFDKTQQAEKADQQRQKDLAKGKENVLIVGLLLTLALAIVAFSGFRNKRRANLSLQEQKEKVEDTLSELKSTQAQLIHSEKMASLGSLATGIAHEIENPLNFMNNFSEINKELLEELQGQIEKGNLSEAMETGNTLIANEAKIIHHGKRADSIVKGMLVHSRTSSGHKEATDLNALADEFFHLSYNSLKAKNKEFGASTKTHFDKNLEKLNVIPQEMGMVLLNLYNNAFYAVAEKKRQLNEGYEPTVSVTTTKSENEVTISVKDNGNGITAAIMDKIFQPFYTTKPPGEGTGLGLSMSYDIIKAHGGEIKVASKEGEYAEFIISLPSNHSGKRHVDQKQ